MNRRITLMILELCLIAMILAHGIGFGFAAIVIGLFWIAGIITRSAARLFPWLGVDGELIAPAGKTEPFIVEVK